MQNPLFSIVFVLVFALGTAHADTNDDQLFQDWDAPAWVSPLEDTTISVTMASGSYKFARLGYRVNDGNYKEVLIEDLDEAQTATPRLAFTIPAADFAVPGTFEYGVAAYSTTHQRDIVAKTREIPIGYAEELDVTGEAAEVLLYPLPDDEYVARYIPCCNIYGGYTYAARVPVNPTRTIEGLPESLVSPFIVLEPDGMSASTMGLYLDMRFDPANIPEGNRIALYEFNLDNVWSEVLSYDMHDEGPTITTHCPQGGIFVLAVVERD